MLRQAKRPVEGDFCSRFPEGYPWLHRRLCRPRGRGVSAAAGNSARPCPPESAARPSRPAQHSPRRPLLRRPMIPHRRGLPPARAGPPGFGYKHPTIASYRDPTTDDDPASATGAIRTDSRGEKAQRGCPAAGGVRRRRPVRDRTRPHAAPEEASQIAPGSTPRPLAVRGADHLHTQR